MFKYCFLQVPDTEEEERNEVKNTIQQTVSHFTSNANKVTMIYLQSYHALCCCLSSSSGSKYLRPIIFNISEMTHNGFACFSLGLSDELDNVHTYKAKRAIYKFVEGSLL